MPDDKGRFRGIAVPELPWQRARVDVPHVAFIGKAGAGKSTAADILQLHLGYERLSFATPLKVMCGTQTDRELLQRVGVGVRELVPDGWVNLLLAELERRQAEGLPGNLPPRFVVDDCRFENEVWALKEHGFKTVRIAATRNLRVARLRGNGKLQDEAQLEHPSETALDGFEVDDTIVNDGNDYDRLRHDLLELLNGWAR